MKIQVKLISGFLAVALAVGLLGYTALSATRDIEDSLEKLNEVDIPAINALHDIREALHHTILAATEYALQGDEKFKNDYQKSKAQYEAAFSKYMEVEEGEADFIEDLSRVAEEIIANSGELIALKDSGASGEALMEKITLLVKAEEEVTSLLNKEIAHDNEELAESQLAIQEKINRAIYGTVLASVFVIIFAIILGYYYSRTISRPILALQKSAEKVSKGDLSVEISPTGEGEIGELAASFRLMVEELKKAREGLETEVKKQTQELVTTLDYLNRLIDTSPIAIISTDLEGRILSFNEHAGEMYGYSGDEIIGRHAKILQPQDLSEKEGKKVVETVLKGGIWEKDILQRRKNGEVFPAHLRIRRLLDEKGKPVGMMSLSIDITDRIKARDKLEAYAQELEESNRLKDLFTDILRHDLLNPVSVIKGVAKIASDDAEGKVEKDLNIISKNAEKLEALIDQAAKLSRIESEKEFLLVVVDLNEFINEVISSLKPAMVEKKMRLEYAAKGEHLMKANPVIEEVFYNLISNAVKYSPKGTKISVSVEEEGDAWLVSVKDEGEGVPDKYKTAIFERFERGGKLGVKGSGLGLAIVKRIVDLHKGRVWVEDNKPRGSIFRVRLPKQP